MYFAIFWRLQFRNAIIKTLIENAPAEILQTLIVCRLFCSEWKAKKRWRNLRSNDASAGMAVRSWNTYVVARLSFGVCLLGCNWPMQIDISATAGVFEIFHTFKICVSFAKCVTSRLNWWWDIPPKNCYLALWISPKRMVDQQYQIDRLLQNWKRRKSG